MFCRLEGCGICCEKNKLGDWLAQAIGSGVEVALVGEGKRVEAFMPVVGVGVLGPLEPVDDEIGDGGGDDLVSNLESVAGGDDVEESSNGVDSAEGEDDDEERIYGLADDGGADGTGPELASVRDELETCHGVGVGELSGPEGDETGGENSRDEAEDRGEGLLIAPSGGRRERDDDRPDEVEEGGAEEAQPDGAAGGGKTVDLGKDVSKDVGDGKEQNGAADRKRADGPASDCEGTDEADLLRDEIGDEQDDDERGGEGVEIFEAAGG